jgi:mannose-6-phosphate isomerase-like protein (cupin superfamily)
MHIDEEAVKVGPNCAIYIPPRAVQHIENAGSVDLVFLCIVDPAWRPEDEEILER